VAIYDATNTTKERRKLILDRCGQENVEIVFIESICHDKAIIERNVLDTKVSSPDYKGIPPEQAVEDFKKRIAEYEKSYQPLDESDSHLTYIKLVDVGRQIIINRVESYLASRIVHFLMNLHINPRPIWLTRHGESEYNHRGLIGGDPDLTAKGDEYAHALADWVSVSLTGDLIVWTSSLKRSISTAQYINYPKVKLRPLDEIDAGICEGMSYEQIAEIMPDEYEARSANKLRYRYPHGESYVDVIQRLEPVLFELERQRSPILVVAHQAVLRCIYAYFLDIPADDIPFVPIEMHSVYELVPRAYGCDVKIHKLNTK